MEKGEELYESMSEYSLESSSLDEKQLRDHFDAIVAQEERFIELEFIKMELGKLEVFQLRLVFQ